MAKGEAAIDPKPIISLMFAISVGFWASQLAQYVSPTSQKSELQHMATELQGRINSRLDRYVSRWEEHSHGSARDLQSWIANRLEEYRADPNQHTESGAAALHAQIKREVESYTEGIDRNETKLLSAARKLQSWIDTKLAKHVAILKPGNRRWQRLVTLVSGVLFLLDLLCIVWWYARYIYRVQSKASFGRYFLDFVVCSMFALAANSWTKPSIFLFATLWGSVFLVCRFWLLYRSSSASLTDQRILRRASLLLVAAVLVAVCGLSVMHDICPWLGIGLMWDGHGLPGALSLIGIVLTLSLRNEIDVAVDIYSAKQAPISPAHLAWPASGSTETERKQVQEQHGRIRHRVKAGIESFDNLFCQFRKHDRIHSRVHSETERRVQSYILALPSCETEEHSDEIEKKAFMVAVSHWLDDLVDGRSEVDVWSRIQRGPLLSDKQAEARKLFELIYRPLIVKHTDRKFYSHLYEMICRSCPLSFNLRYMLLGLNRVAYGSCLFSPRIPHADRWRILKERHNLFLKEWNVEGVGKDLENEVERILDEVAVGDDAGPILLGLTTKTVQEVALSSENGELNVSLSILFSIIYAPLIYYHNIVEELDNSEMVPLQAFDTDSDLWIPWLRRVRKAIDTFDKGKRRKMRAQQIEMAYRCFEPMLPRSIRPDLQKIYVPVEADKADSD